MRPVAAAATIGVMDFSQMVFSGSLDPSFPLPHDQPFTASAAVAAGISRKSLTALVKAGLLRRPIKGVYLATEVGDSLALRAACLRLVAPSDCVVVDRHAGWLLGARMVLAPGEHLEVRPLSLYRPSGNGRLRNDIARSGERWLPDAHVLEVEGLRVTTPIRTAWDLGRVRSPGEAIAGMDAMLRLGGFEREELLDGIRQFRGHRWVTTLRAIAPLADGRSESPGESVLRLRCIECQVAVTPQVEVWRGDRLVARLDLANELVKGGFEYDGVEWHDSPEQQAHDRARRADAAEDGWLIGVARSKDLWGRNPACERMIRDIWTRALARRGRRLAS